MNWLIVALIIVLVLIIFKKEIEHKTTKVIVVMLVFFVISMFFSYGTIKQQNVDLKSVEGIKTAAGIYFSWLGNALTNAKTITANVVKMDWTPNVTLSNSSKKTK